MIDFWIEIPSKTAYYTRVLARYVNSLFIQVWLRLGDATRSKSLLSVVC